REFVFTQDGRRLCSWEADFRLRVWDAATGRLIAEHAPRPEGFPKDFDDEDERARRRRGGIKEIHHLASISGFSPDGSRFYWIFNKLRSYDTATGKEVQTIGEDIDLGYYGPKLSNDQQWLLIGGGSDRGLTVINTRLGKKFGRVEFLDGTRTGASTMSPDGRSFAVNTTSSTGTKIVLYETATLRPRLAIPLEYGYAYRLA